MLFDALAIFVHVEHTLLEMRPSVWLRFVVGLWLTGLSIQDANHEKKVIVIV